jgi:hypothetical protein
VTSCANTSCRPHKMSAKIAITQQSSRSLFIPSPQEFAAIGQHPLFPKFGRIAAKTKTTLRI